MNIRNYLGLDVGDRHVGISMAYGDIKIAIPHKTLYRNGDTFWDEMINIINTNNIKNIIVGLPRSLDGNETAQTKKVREFVKELESKTKRNVIWQDEALTSIKAESMLRSSGKKYNKSDIDAYAASIILSDYLVSV